MKYIALILVTLVLAGCVPEDNREQQKTESGRQYMVECIDGVEYWTGVKRLAPRIDPATMTFRKCK